VLVLVLALALVLVVVMVLLPPLAAPGEPAAVAAAAAGAPGSGGACDSILVEGSTSAQMVFGRGRFLLPGEVVASASLPFARLSRPRTSATKPVHASTEQKKGVATSDEKRQ